MKSRFLVVWFALLSSFVSPQSSFCQSPKTKDTVLVRRGVTLKFLLVKPLSSETANVGDDVPLLLARPLVVDGVTLLEPGVLAHGKVTKVRRAGPNCRSGRVQWKVDNLEFADGSKAKTEMMVGYSGGRGDVPERVPSSAIQRGRHDAWRRIAYAPLFAVELPFLVLLVIAMSSGDGGPCTTPGQDYVLPSNYAIAVAIAKNHRVHY